MKDSTSDPVETMNYLLDSACEAVDTLLLFLTEMDEARPRIPPDCERGPEATDFQEMMDACDEIFDEASSSSYLGLIID